MSPYGVLLAFPAGKEDTVALVRRLLSEKIFSGDRQGEILWVTDATQAREALANGHYHLVIADVQLPEDSSRVIGEGSERVLGLVQSLEEGPTPIPSLLVAVEPAAELYQAAQELTDCRVIPEDDRFHHNILKYVEKFLVRRLYRPQVPSAPLYQVQEAAVSMRARKIANIDIAINLDKRYGDLVEGHYSIRGFGFNYDKNGLLWLDYETLLQLREKSWELEDLESWPDWQEKLGEVGNDLSRQIFNQIHKGNQEFMRNFLEVLTRVGSMENTRLRFTLKRETFPVIMEALRDAPLRPAPLTEAEEKFLMLQAPIYRRVDIPIDQEYPLFADGLESREPLNCLIIEADASGYVPALDEGLPALAGLRTETEWLVSYLQGLRQAALKGEAVVRIGEILRLDRDTVPAGRKFSDCLKEVLQRQNAWQLVHFAGHSTYVQRLVQGQVQGKGYFIFPGLGGQDNEAMEVSELCIYLRKRGVRLLYLSSCYSAATEFVIELANHLIPAILGFRWRVADAKACSHTKSFYRHLFERRSVDQAFLETRRDMYREDPQDRTWAAPLLIMQISN